MRRDSEYVRYGNQSFDGRNNDSCQDNHKSSDYISFLNQMDQQLKDYERIWLILDNQSAHVSKETMEYLEQKPNRFGVVFTPKHGSWLNITESFFSKLTCVSQRNLRVDSKEELEECILSYIAEINRDPVIFKWTYKMDEIIL